MAKGTHQRILTIEYTVEPHLRGVRARERILTTHGRRLPVRRHRLCRPLAARSRHAELPMVMPRLRRDEPDSDGGLHCLPVSCPRHVGADQCEPNQARRARRSTSGRGCNQRCRRYLCSRRPLQARDHVALRVVAGEQLEAFPPRASVDGTGGSQLCYWR